MPLISQSIPNLINGVSQQTATQRNPTQAELQQSAPSSDYQRKTRKGWRCGGVEWVNEIFLFRFPTLQAYETPSVRCCYRFTICV